MDRAATDCTLAQAAHTLGKSQSTLRRWIAEGAPCVSPGESGRGNGAIVDPGALARWRAGIADRANADVLQVLADTLADVFKRDAGYGEPAHRTFGIRDHQAAALLAHIWEQFAATVTHNADPTPPQTIADLIGLAKQTAHK